MRQISRNEFRNLFLRPAAELLSDTELPAIPSEDVKEHRIGKNTFFEVVSESPYKIAQEKIYREFLTSFPLNSAAVGFRSGFSYLNFLEPHKNGHYFLRLDVRSFFHSLSNGDVRDVFAAAFEDELLIDEGDQTLVDAFMALVTYTVPDDSDCIEFRGQTILPMGFLTSPVISNIVFRRIDLQIQKYCTEKEVAYTRYADDMLFSSGSDSRFVHSDTFEKEVRILISQLGLKLNASKTLKATHTISLNGYVVQNETVVGDPVFQSIRPREIRVSQKKTGQIEKLIYAVCEKDMNPLLIMEKYFNYDVESRYSAEPIRRELREAYAAHQLYEKAAGYRSFLLGILKFNERYGCVSEHTISKYSRLINDLNIVLQKYEYF